MENHDFYKLILPADFILFDIKNFKQVQYRSLNLLEKIILSIANYFSDTKFSVYEVLFTTCLKISMKPLIQSILDELYYNNYLELETDFKIDILSNNLINIQNDVYNDRGQRESKNRIHNLESSKNCLEFSNEIIQGEIQKILSQTRYLYQYKINKRGIKALNENRLKTYKDDGNSSLELISINCPNEKLSILNHILSSRDTSGFTRMRATERNIYLVISEILTDKDNLLKPKDTDFDFISFNNNSEIEETSSKNGDLKFNYDIKSELLSINVHRGLLNGKLQEIINENLDFFKQNKVLDCNPFEFLQDKIINQDSDFHYPKDNFKIKNSKLYLDINSFEELEYIKKYLPEPYKKSINDNSYRYEFIASDYNLRINFPLVLYPNPSNNDVFSAYTKDFLYSNYIEDKKIISYKDLDNIFDIVYRKYSDTEEELSNTLKLNRSEVYKDLIEDDKYEIYIVDELIKSNIIKDFPDLFNTKYEIVVNTKQIPYKLIMKLGIEGVRSLYSSYPEGLSSFEIQMKDLIKKEINYEVKLFPNRSKNTHKELIKVQLIRRFGINALAMRQDFINSISEILDDWDDSSKWYGEDFNNSLKNILTDLESEEFSNFYGEVHESNDILLSVFEIEAEKIRTDLEFQLKLEIGTPSKFNLEEQKFNLLYYLNFQDVNNYLEREDELKVIKKSLIEHQDVFSVNINENLTLNSNLVRIIKFDHTQNQDPEKVIKLFLSIFSKILQQNDFSSITKSFTQFENFIKDYNSILNQNNLDELIPFHFSDDISTIFIDEINKIGYLFLENLVINELNKQIKGDYEFDINYLKISNESNRNIWYEINDENLKEISNHLDLMNPITIQLTKNQMDLDLNCYFLPQMNDQNIFQMKFFDEIITKRLIKNESIVKGEDYFLLEELRDKLEGEFNNLIDLYNLVEQEHFLSNTRIRKYINRKLKDEEFLKDFHIINPFINQEIQSDPILSKYKLFNPNKIEISNKKKSIEIKLSKKEILSLDAINDFKHITKMYGVNIDIKENKLN